MRKDADTKAMLRPSVLNERDTISDRLQTILPVLEHQEILACPAILEFREVTECRAETDGREQRGTKETKVSAAHVVSKDKKGNLDTNQWQEFQTGNNAPGVI